MLFKNIAIIDENFDVCENMYVGVKGSYIDYVGSEIPTADYGEIYDGNNKLLIPAFYNMHTHMPMSLLRGYSENLPLAEWLNDKIFPFEAHLSAEDKYWGHLQGIAESLRYGVCASTDMYLDEDASCRAVCESGFKANISNSFMCFDDSDYTGSEFNKNTLEAISKYNGYDDGRVKVEFALHAEYTSNEKVAKQLAAAAIENHSSIHVHVSESASEVAECRERHEGRSPVKYLADCGIFDVPAVAAHCVHVTDEDIEILRDKNVTVASCPMSNLKLASGIAPTARMLKAGVNVTVGTDGVASNNNLNMLEEMRFFNLLQKGVYGDPTLISPKETLYIATRAGAIGQGRSDCGLIKEGYRADIAVFNTDTVSTFPEHDKLNNLIYSAQGTDVVLTMIDGKVLYKDGMYTTLDIEKINYECEKSRLRILDAI